VTDVRTGAATERGELPAIPLPVPRQPVAPLPAELPPGDRLTADADLVELGRLLALAWLTPAQAVEVGTSLLAAVAAPSDPDIAAGGGAQETIGQVLIGADGRVVLRPTPNRRDDGGPPAGQPPEVAVGAVLADVARAARLRARGAGPAAEQLLAELDRAVAELPEAGVPAAARRLGEVAARTDPGAVRAELGALAAAIRGLAAPAPGGGRAGAPSTAARRTPAPRASSRGGGRTGRRIGAWLLSILVLGGVGVLEVALLRDKVAADINVLLDAGRNGSTPSAAPPPPDGLPVVPPAPAAAGSVRAVDLRPLAPCTPGTPCTVRVLVQVVAAADPQVLTWSYHIVDRCTGTVAASPGGSVPVPAGADRVAVVATVALPTAQAVGLVAVTEAPAAAASAPVLVGSCGAGTATATGTG
jgi:hypothetical protein